MRVPRFLLRDTIALEDYGGSGARGPLYATSRNVRGSVQPKTALVTDSRGQAVTITALVIIRPEDGPVPAESRATTRGVTYRVIQAYPMPDERRPTHYELVLSKFVAA